MSAVEPPQGGSSPWRQVALVVNTRSRAGEKAFDAANELLREHGVPVHVAYPLRGPERLPETVQEVLNAGCDLLIIGGGDGTVSSTVDFLAGHDAVLGLLPLGTANDFARTLEVPTSLREACATIAHGKIVDVDLGLAGDNYFVNVASAGLSVAVTRALHPGLKKRAGALAYPVATFKALGSYEPFSAKLIFPDTSHEPVEFDQLLQLAVGNGRFYGGGLVVAPGSGIDDTLLDVYAMRRGRRRDLFHVARTMKSGAFIHSDTVAHYQTPRVLLEAEPPQAINIDGEIVTHSPKNFEVARNALKVVVPADSTAASLDH